MFFYEIIPNDSNRAQDGMDLRLEYRKKYRVDGRYPLECSVLEMLIGVARRMEYLTRDPNEISGDQTSTWFWALIANLDLIDFTDDVALSNFITNRRITRTFDLMIARSYDWTGRGGLFPLKDPRDDQRNLEIWSQMNLWLGENVFQ